MQVDNQPQSSSSSEMKNTERSCGSRVGERKEASSTSSHGAGIACNAVLLGSSSRLQQQQHQMTAGGVSSLQQRLADLSQMLSNSIEVPSSSTVSTDLTALMEVLTAAAKRPAHK